MNNEVLRKKRPV